MAITLVNIFLLASCHDCISDCQASVAVDLNKCNVLNGTTERTPAAVSGPFGHLGFLEEHVGVVMYRLRRESCCLRLLINSAL